MTSRLQIDPDFNNTVGEWIWGPYRCYGARAQKSRHMNDPSGGSRVLIAGIVMISTVGEAILREGIASMHADGIDVRFLAISRRWDLATSVCSEYFFSRIQASESVYLINPNFKQNPYFGRWTS